MILTGITTYIVVCFVAFRLSTLRDFLILAVLVGTAQGGIQALSRSFFGKLVPQESASEYFGFFDVFGKFSAVIGPTLFGIVAQATGVSRRCSACSSSAGGLWRSSCRRIFSGFIDRNQKRIKGRLPYLLRGKSRRFLYYFSFNSISTAPSSLSDGQSPSPSNRPAPFRG